MLVSRLRLRRHATVLALRSARVLRHHYFSFVSAIILGGALVVALTTSSLDDRGPDRSPSVGSSGTARSAVAAPEASAVPTMSPASQEHWIVYYLVDMDEDRIVLQGAIRGDAIYRMENNMPEPNIDVYFLHVRNAREESNAAHILHEVAHVATREGFNLQVIDLR